MKLQELRMTLRKIGQEISRAKSNINELEKAAAKLEVALWKLKEEKEKKVEIRTVLTGLKETWKQGDLEKYELHEPYYTFLIRKGGEFLPAFPEEWGKRSGISEEIAIVPIEKLSQCKCPKCGKFSLLIRRCELEGVVTPKGDSEAEEEKFLVICCGEAQRVGIIPAQSKVAPA